MLISAWGPTATPLIPPTSPTPRTVSRPPPLLSHLPCTSLHVYTPPPRPSNGPFTLRLRPVPPVRAAAPAPAPQPQQEGQTASQTA